jgi:magnesium-transporting ATPase (P-type)
MSPTKKPVTRVRERSEVVVAVAVAVGIVLVTAFLIWALRPATPGVPGTGGIMTRQSRFWLWLVLSVGVMAWAIWWVRNGNRRPRKLNATTSILLAVIVVGVLALLAAIFWPSGLIKHTPSAPKVDTTPPATLPPTTAGNSTATTVSPATQPRTTSPTSPPTTKGS